MTTTRSSPPPATSELALPPARTIARRAGLPGGRAVAGALLVVTAGVGTFTLSSGDGTPSTRYPVAARPLDPGSTIDAGDLEWRPMALDADVGDRTFADAALAEGAVVLVPLAAGDLVRRDDLATGPAAAAPAGAQLSIPVPLERTPPGLRRGERVTLLATYGSGGSATTVRTVEGATVLDLETDPESIGGRERGRLTVALADPAALVATAHAAQVAELTVVRTTGAAITLPESYRRDEPRPSA